MSLQPGGSSSTLTERLLRQNAELTGFVSRLTEEKNDLRNHTLRLEEELQRYRQSGQGSGDRVSSLLENKNECNEKNTGKRENAESKFKLVEMKLEYQLQ